MARDTALADLTPPSHAASSAPADEAIYCRDIDLPMAIERLTAGAERLAMRPLDDRIRLVEAVRQNVIRVAREWVDRSAATKQTSPTHHVRSEEILSGPVVTARYLRLLRTSFEEIRAHGRPRLPGRPRRGSDDRILVPVAPVRGMFDGLAFMGFSTWARMRSGITEATLPLHTGRLFQQPDTRQSPQVTLVLGAGNITSVPILDACEHVLVRGESVLLKLHPIHEPLEPLFARLLSPLIEADCLAIFTGDATAGQAAISHPSIDRVHITGGVATHDAIAWGPPGPEQEERRRLNQPKLDKPISAELGNVSPWIVLPGDYSDKQFAYQAENVAASIINNAGCNCVATRVLVTWRGWERRQEFVDRVADLLATAAARDPWYPGAADRYATFTGDRFTSAPLPARLVREVNPSTASRFFDSEPFTCVAADVPVEARTPSEFASQAIEFCNNQLWGTLSATLTVPRRWQKRRADRLEIDRMVASLRYGMVGLNQWVGLNYALASPPWGGHPDSTLQDVQSGNARVHNTFLLDGVDQVILQGPLTSFPRPTWFPSHHNPEPLSWALLDLYNQPSLKSLWRLIRCN